MMHLVVRLSLGESSRVQRRKKRKTYHGKGWTFLSIFCVVISEWYIRCRIISHKWTKYPTQTIRQHVIYIFPIAWHIHEDHAVFTLICTRINRMAHIKYFRIFPLLDTIRWKWEHAVTQTRKGEFIGNNELISFSVCLPVCFYVDMF